ncbi:MAG: endonuclease III [Clostridia bacterium]|nr:endonuclease III [Clostridia bacterium]
MISPKSRAAAAAAALEKLYPGAECSLAHGGDPFRLLVMARLSAQCTDERVNIVSEELFRRFPTAEAMAEADVSEIEELIRSCGLYHTKAQSIRDASRILVRDYGGRVPDTMEDLLALPGVGRKIANLVLGDVYGKGGIVADTHCIRICGRLGFYDETKKDPLLTERVMTPLLPPEVQSAFCHRIVLFGREWCSARAPRCAECPLRGICETPGDAQGAF